MPWVSLIYLFDVVFYFFIHHYNSLGFPFVLQIESPSPLPCPLLSLTFHAPHRVLAVSWVSRFLPLWCQAGQLFPSLVNPLQQTPSQTAFPLQWHFLLPSLHPWDVVECVFYQQNMFCRANFMFFAPQTCFGVVKFFHVFSVIHVMDMLVCTGFLVVFICNQVCVLV